MWRLQHPDREQDRRDEREAVENLLDGESSQDAAAVGERASISQKNATSDISGSTGQQEVCHVPDPMDGKALPHSRAR